MLFASELWGNYPADAKLFAGDFLSVDQSALTGESLPEVKRWGTRLQAQWPSKACWPWRPPPAGNTFFGRTASLVQTAGAVLLPKSGLAYRQPDLPESGVGGGVNRGAVRAG